MLYVCYGHFRNVKDVLLAEFKLDTCHIERKGDIPRDTDILIMGGGLVGAAVAYFLSHKSSNMFNVTVVERDYAVRMLF